MLTRKDPRLFDATKPLVMARFATLHAHDMQVGDPLTIEEEQGTDKGSVDLGLAIRLWMSDVAMYGEDLTASPIETPEETAARVVEMDDLGGGWFLIRAPWLGEGEKVQGKAAAEARRIEIVDRGDTKGVTIGGGAGGWFEVQAPWLDEPQKVQGKDAAQALADQIIADGPPEGWRLLTPEEQEAAKEEQLALQAAREEADRVAEEGRLADEKAIAEAKAREAAANAGTAPTEPVPGPEGTAVAQQGNGDAADQSQGVTVPSADFTVAPNGDGFEITGPGITDPIVVGTADEANAKVAELRAAAGTPTANETAQGTDPTAV